MPEVLEWLRQILPLPVKQYAWAAWGLYTNPWFWVPFAAILVAEWRWPAVPAQRTISPALVEDGLWLNIELVVRASLLPITAATIATGYQQITGGATFPWLVALPMGARIALSLVLYDLLMYVIHRLLHGVPLLWHFHAVHHSQAQLNSLTASRSHVGEYLVAQVLLLTPMLVLGMTPFAIVGTSAALTWFNRLTHANLRWTFGGLGGFVVSPQYHRIHHSLEARHHDRNYAQVLCVWDRLFGTTYRVQGEYPPTGLADAGLAAAASRNPLRAVPNVLAQLWYPFRRIAAGGWRFRNP